MKNNLYAATALTAFATPFPAAAQQGDVVKPNKAEPTSDPMASQ
jgi:hypothetical protein